MNTNKIQHELRTFTGTTSFHRLSLVSSVIFTDGAKYLAEKTKAFWLMDLVASYHLKFPKHDFLAFDLAVDLEKKSATVKISDGNSKQLATQEIEYTDFPFESMTLWGCLTALKANGPTLRSVMLPSEY